MTCNKSRQVLRKGQHEQQRVIANTATYGIPANTALIMFPGASLVKEHGLPAELEFKACFVSVDLQALKQASAAKVLNGEGAYDGKL